MGDDLMDSKTLMTAAIFLAGQILIALIYGARLGTKVDAFKDEFIGFKRDVNNVLTEIRKDVNRIGERTAHVEGRLAGSRNTPPTTGSD